jgi:RNA polymerase sigma-70 factor (ECF subfamily)
MPRSAPRVELSAEVLARATAGDAEAFLLMYRRFHGPMSALAARWLGDDEGASEVVQESWEAIIKGLVRFEGRSKLSTWIFAIVVNKARERRRKDGRATPFSALGEPDEDHEARFSAAGAWIHPPAPWTRGADAIVADRQAMAHIARLLAELPATQRAVVTLRDVEGLDAAEVCNLLQITESNQRVLLHRGRIKLRAWLEALEGQR